MPDLQLQTTRPLLQRAVAAAVILPSLKSITRSKKHIILCNGACILFISFAVLFTGCAANKINDASADRQIERVKQTNIKEGKWAGIPGGDILEKDEDAERADALFTAEQYDAAFEIYDRLAKQADKFSQYRLAFQYEHGLGVERDLIEAYAWATLAAEFNEPQLSRYAKNLKARLDKAQLAEAQEKSLDYLRKYSNLALAQKMLKEQRDILRGCTGSRTGNTCLSGTLRVGRLVQSAPGDGHLSRVAGLKISDDATGFDYYLPIKQNVVHLQNYITEYLYTFGDVTLGEFEIIEDETE